MVCPKALTPNMSAAMQNPKANNPHSKITTHAAILTGSGVSTAAGMPNHSAITRATNLNLLAHCIAQNADGLRHCSNLHGYASLPKHAKLAPRNILVILTCRQILSFQKTLDKFAYIVLKSYRIPYLDWEDEFYQSRFGLWINYNNTVRQIWLFCLVCLLRIEPAGPLPLRAKQFVIVNLQPKGGKVFTLKALIFLRCAV